MITINNDGIREYQDYSGNVYVYFEDWLKYVSAYSTTWEDVYDTLLSSDEYSEDDIFAIKESLEAEFYNYCDSLGYTGELC